MKWIGHTLHENSLLRTGLKGRTEGKKDPGRPRNKMLLDWMMDKRLRRRYKEMKEKAQNWEEWHCLNLGPAWGQKEEGILAVQENITIIKQRTIWIILLPQTSEDCSFSESEYFHREWCDHETSGSSHSSSKADLHVWTCTCTYVRYVFMHIRMHVPVCIYVITTTTY